MVLFWWWLWLPCAYGRPHWARRAWEIYIMCLLKASFADECSGKCIPNSWKAEIIDGSRLDTDLEVARRWRPSQNWWAGSMETWRGWSLPVSTCKLRTQISQYVVNILWYISLICPLAVGVRIIFDFLSWASSQPKSFTAYGRLLCVSLLINEMKLVYKKVTCFE